MDYGKDLGQAFQSLDNANNITFLLVKRDFPVPVAS